MEFQLYKVVSERDPRKVERALRSLPRRIADAYQDILERVATEGNNELVFKILSWIFHAKGHLLMDELREALAVEPGDTQLHRKFLLEPALILDECKSLITHDEASGIVKFTHNTIHQFLEETKPQSLLDVVELAKALLTYLSFDVFKNPCTDASELKKRITVNKLCSYAARYWPEYVRGKGEHDRELQNLLFGLFQSSQLSESMLQMEGMTANIPEGGSRLAHFATFYRLEYICRILFQLERPDSLPLPPKNDIQTSDDIAVSAEIYGDVRSRDGCGETPLHIAARLGYIEIVKLLLEANAEVDAKSKNSADMTPLHLAVTRGHNEVVNILVKAKADLNARCRYAQETPLLLAAFLGRKEIVDTLLKAKAELTATIEGVGETAIMRAFNTPKAVQVVSSLLKAGADIDAQDSDGRTALHYALMNAHSLATCKEMLQLLLGAGADVNIPCTVYGRAAPAPAGAEPGPAAAAPCTGPAAP